MGISGGLFFSVNDNKNSLSWRIKPSDEQRERQMERWNDLRNHLVEDLAKRSNLSMYSWLQGSYKFSTQVRPARSGLEFDIDLGIYFRWAGYPNDGTFSPLALKAFVQESCVEYVAEDTNDASAVADPMARCCRVHFDEDFHIDVPCYHLDTDRDARSLATEKDEWEDSDPKAIYQWWKDITEKFDRPKVRRIVRYMKMWAALTFAGKDFSPSSILLTVLAAEAVEDIGVVEGVSDDDLLFSVVSTVYDRLLGSTRVGNPAHNVENLNRLSTEQNQVFLQEISRFVSIGRRALDAPDKSASAEIWAEVFEHFFPIPDDTEDVVARVAEGRELAVIRFDPQVQVRAMVGKRVIEDINRIGPIPKNCDIKFYLLNESELPTGAQVRWTVRNAGQEAEDKNDLGHRGGEGNRATENSAYRGRHYMDVSVNLAGNLIGRRRVPVDITGLGVPSRNPPRPSWTKLR